MGQENGRTKEIRIALMGIFKIPVPFAALDLSLQRPDELGAFRNESLLEFMYLLLIEPDVIEMLQGLMHSPAPNTGI